jgi:hypothetical protein
VEIDTLNIYVEARLRSWAREILGGMTNLDFPSTNMLSRDHGLRGGARVQMSDDTYVTERIMIELRREAPAEAIVLEAVYRGHGRWSEERREDAEERLGRKLSRRQFWTMYQSAFDRVRAYFDLLAKAA